MTATWPGARTAKPLSTCSNRDGAFRLYTVNVATRETRQLTKSPGTDTNPFFSPDGKWIAFRRGPKTGISLIKPDGTGEQVVVKGPNVDEFHWSPDGKWLTYEQEDPIRNEDILGRRRDAGRPGDEGRNADQRHGSSRLQQPAAVVRRRQEARFPLQPLPQPRHRGRSTTAVALPSTPCRWREKKTSSRRTRTRRSLWRSRAKRKRTSRSL